VLGSILIHLRGIEASFQAGSDRMDGMISTWR
jgi:hypothetical protein